MDKTVISVFVLVATILGFASSADQKAWTRNLSIEKGIRMNWIHDDSEYVTMEISAPAKGYVAVGISPNGSMTGADMIMGWVDSQGKAHIKVVFNTFWLFSALNRLKINANAQDTYGIGNTKPREDKQSNVELIRGEETEAGTTIQFKRKWDTLDTEQDIAIKVITCVKASY